jgi:electron transfer flavoprotein alpha/beta subunit
MCLLRVQLTEKEAPSLVIVGKQSIDGDNTQTGTIVALLQEATE